MGGLIRAAKTARLWYNGEEKNALFVGSGEVWRKPLKSIFNNPGVSTTDDIIGIGSSDMGCIHYNTWNIDDGYHAWYPMFRDNYAGNLITSVQGSPPIPGSDIDNLIYGRADLFSILQAGRSNSLPGGAINAEDKMDDFNALVFEFSDLTPPSGVQNYFPKAVQDDPTLMNGYNSNPQIFNFPYFQSQYHINKELYAIMEYVRAFKAEGGERMYLCAPWPRLIDFQASSEDDLWYLRLEGLEDFMNYIQDRVNYQLDKENLGGHMSMVPYHRLFKRIWDDLEGENVPAVTPVFNNFRMLFANEDQTGDPLSIIEDKHWYMLNHWGAYAINCLYGYVVLGVDPRGMSNSAGVYTVPQALAEYFQEIAVEEADNFPRTGKRRSGDVGFILPTLRDWEPEEIMGPDRTVTALGDVSITESSPQPTGSIRGARHFFMAFDVDEDFDPENTSDIDNAIFALTNAAGQRQLYMSANRFDLHHTLGTTHAVLFNNNAYSGAGDKKVFYEIRLYPSGEETKQGYNTTIMCLAGNKPFGQHNFLDHASSTGHNQPTAAPIVATQVICPSEGITLRSFISCTEILNDGDTMNMWRYLSRIHQCHTWDLLTPDMIA